MNLTNPTNLVIVIVYYILVGLLSFFSIFGVYILIRYGKSSPLALSISLVYIFLFIKILTETYQTLAIILV